MDVYTPMKNGMTEMDKMQSYNLAEVEALFDQANALEEACRFAGWECVDVRKTLVRIVHGKFVYALMAVFGHPQTGKVFTWVGREMDEFEIETALAEMKRRDSRRYAALAWKALADKISV